VNSSCPVSMPTDCIACNAREGLMYMVLVARIEDS
jgi:hypothetical protein